MAATLSVAEHSCERDVLWEHCRNGLGIARLLVHERRPAYLVATACRMAVESAVRAGLEQAGLSFDGDLRRGLGRLAAPPELANFEAGTRTAAAQLAATEHAVAWLAAWLRDHAPDRAWGY